MVTVNYPVTLPGFIDRYLVSAMAYRIPASLVFNKLDLYNEKDYEKLEEYLQTYESIGYKCYQVSADTKRYISGVWLPFTLRAG